MQNTPPIFISGLPRSGSTWVLNVITSAENTFKMMEPDHLDLWGIGYDGIHPYIRLKKENKKYFRIYKKAFKGRSKHPISFEKSYISHLLRQARSYRRKDKRVVVKSIYSIANTEWIHERFRPDILIILRNPYSLIHSIHRNWPETRLQGLLDQPHLMKDYLEPYRNLIKAARTPYEILATRVGAYYKIILEMAERHPEWTLCTHEELCRAPVPQFQTIFDRLNLKWSENVEQFINRSNTPKQNDDEKHTNRVAGEEFDKWRHLLTKEEMREIRNFYLPFEVNLYREYVDI